MTTEERIKHSETTIFKAVFPNTTNHYDTLFGGTAMQLMDETAFIAATRFSRQQMVTVSSDKIDFKQPIPAGTIIELKGKLVEEVLEKEPGYFGWLLNADFPRYTKKVLTAIKLRALNTKI